MSAHLRAIDGGKGQPAIAVVELLREVLAEAEAGRIQQVLVLVDTGDEFHAFGALSDPWRMAGAATLHLIPWLQEQIEEDQ